MYRTPGRVLEKKNKVDFLNDETHYVDLFDR